MNRSMRPSTSVVVVEGALSKNAIECVSVVEGKRYLRYAAIVEKRDEQGVFVFTANRVPCLQSGDLSLEYVIPIDAELRCHAEFCLLLKSSCADVSLEMPRDENSTLFLTEVTRARDLQTQSLAFGEVPTFSWLEPFRVQCTQGNPAAPTAPQTLSSTSRASKTSDSNPFADDTFDPLRHMNLQTTDTKVMATDVGLSRSTWFEDDFSSMSLKPPEMLNSSQRSVSSNSLDKILDDTDGFTDSMSSLEKQLGISPSVEIPVGSKPPTSREKFVRQILSDREDEFTDQTTFRVFCGTWNVNGQSPAEALHKWMVVDNEAPDIYAICFQELDLSKEAFIFTDSAKETEWQNAVKAYLHPKAAYRKVKSIRLIGVLLIVYIQEKHVPHVKFIDTDSVPTGIMGFLGNKGGVAVRMTLHSTSLCFVNCHLAAHQNESERRVQDYHDILAKTRFKQFEPPLCISEHDVIFWIGDMNFRIDLPNDEVRTSIRQGKLKKLLEQDQLVKLMKSGGDVFKGFEEGIPQFDPTYRFDAGTDVYDSSEKNRIPAWCDRILWQGPGIQILRYDSHPHLKVSDHKPVSALFNTKIRVIDQKRYKRVYEDIMKKMDRLENDYLPQIKLDKTEIVFNDVKFIEAQSTVVTIANVGQAPVEFQFINKLDDTSYCRPWLKATPNQAIISAGHCCEVTVEVYVDKSSVARLNAGEEKMEDILVLHLNGGKDSFVSF
ncbi:inositol polyphosphate 5-phosphatase OCRL-1-like [Elysia marginata]|uniref:Inositol polyphosphate 5-phosphatase OCRL-1-like n=1 Tax=Elysia marginata TaxID=1093978 RepID=A0AAV4IVN3_9GAST|nr:inositol polyphosphate 5-phosphatase OCRL-1-like [Elysia marginata]